MISGVEIFSKLSPIDTADYQREFREFRVSAKRLELLPSYSVRSEDKSFAAFSDGREIPEFNFGWHDILRQAKTRCAKVLRLRGVPDAPTPYLRFEINAGYTASSALGEDIRFITMKSIKQSVGMSPLFDFWVFDDERVYAVFYDAFGGYLGAMRAELLVAKQLISQFDTMFVSGADLCWGLSYANDRH